MFPCVTILLQHQSRTVLRRKDKMNSTVLGYVYEIVIFTFSWLLRIASPMSSALRSNFKLPWSFWDSRLAFAASLPFFPFQKSKMSIFLQKVGEKKDIAAQDRQVLDIFISISKRKNNYFWRFCKSLKQLEKHSCLKINGFFPNPFVTHGPPCTTGDPWTTAGKSHFRPPEIKPIRLPASWQTGTCWKEWIFHGII